MTDARWQEISALLSAGLERPPTEREEFVRTRASDSAIADEVLSLLEAASKTGEFDFLYAALRPEEKGPTGDEPPMPDRLGPFRVLRELGRGGMGAVYLAERADGQFDQTVALKVVRPDRGSDELWERFGAERRILARLQHPNIARLLDGNVTAEGRPYLVMEYVAGVPLMQYCDARRLDVSHRLELFREICAAVQHAHRNLVVHRDLKPSNILVTDEGDVKLLDFGIAKLLDPESDAESDETRAGVRPLTPEYASPEQLRGLAVTTLSDVYQLGILLYELLSGRRPWYPNTPSLADIQRSVLETDPVRPSAALTRSGGAVPHQAEPEELARARGSTLPALRRQLSGDLDHIVLKAIRKQPESRYGSVAELVADVRRHEERRPITARRGTVRYKTSRFVRRNRLGVAATAAIALAMVAGTAGTAWQARRAGSEARLAEASAARATREAEKAAQVSRFLTDMFEVAGEGDVRTDTLRLLPILERAAARIEEELDGQPEVGSEVMIVVSDLYEKLGRFDDAHGFAARALILRRSVYDSLDPEIAHALDNIGGVELDRGNVEQAESHFDEAVRIRRAHVAAGPTPVDSQTTVGLATSVHNLSLVVWRLRHLERADSLATEAIELRRSAGADQSREAANARDVLSLIRRDQGEREEAVELSQEALAIRRRILPNPHIELAVGMNNVASQLLELGQAAESETLYRESLAVRRSLLGDEHPQVATAVHNLGAALKELGRTEEAVAQYEEALALRRRLLGDEHLDVALSLSSIGLLYHEEERCRDAIPLLRESLPVWRRGLGEDHPLVFKTVGLLGDCLSKTGQYADAERELLGSYAGLVTAVGTDHSESRRVRRFLFEMYESWGRPDRAADYAAGGGG